MDEKRENEAKDIEIEPLSDEALESASGGVGSTANRLADADGSSNSCCSCSSCS